jgi:hypothetical protein
MLFGQVVFDHMETGRMSNKQQDYALKTLDAYHKTPFFLSPQLLAETTWPNVIWPAHGMELTDLKMLDNLPVSMW